MKKVKLLIKGVKPFLYHKFNIESISSQNKIKEGTSGNNPSEWKNTFWHEEKKLFVPGSYFLPAITAGGKFVKVGRGTISPKIPSAITILDEKVYFNRELPDKLEYLTNDSIPHDSSAPIYLDIRGVSNPNTKGKNVRYRLALSPGWELQPTFLWDDTIISKDQLNNALEALAKLVGFSDGRTLGYGRFDIIDFDVEDY